MLKTGNFTLSSHLNAYYPEHRCKTDAKLLELYFKLTLEPFSGALLTEKGQL